MPSMPWHWAQRLTLMDSTTSDQAEPASWAETDEREDNASMQMEENSYIPAEMKRHFDFLDINKDGRLLLGTSSLTSRYWTGDVWLFNKASDAPSVDHFTAAKEMESGVSCGKFIDGLGLRAVVCQDLGVIEVVGWEEPGSDGSQPDQLLVTHGRGSEHDDAVLSLDTLASGAPSGGGGDADTEATRAATGGADGCLKLWDLETLVSERSYPGAHRHWVTGVSAHPSHPALLATCGLDGHVILWDTRAAKPAKLLCNSRCDRPQCIAWSPTDVTTIALGWESGRVSLLSAISGEETLAVVAHRRPLHRVRWHPSRPWLATCADETQVHVLDASEKLNTVYSDELHVEMVRDLAWFPESDQLFSCGWDRQVHRRSVR